MAKPDTPPTYSCLAPRSDLRRVHEPHDERVAAGKGSQPLRRALAKVAAAVRS